MFASDNRVAVVSSAQTELRPAWSGLQHVDLISTAVTKALKGSGLRMEDIDFVIDAGSDILDGRSISNCGFLGAMGAHQKEESRVEEDGLWAALYAATKIAAGPAEIGLVVAYSKPSESDLSKFYASQTEPFTQRPVGFGHEAAVGLQAQAYLAGSDVTGDQLADIVAHDYANAAKNPAVQVVDAIDAAAVKASPSVAAPLRKLDLSRPVDGAVAMVVTSRAVAERVTSTPVWITGIGTAMDLHSFAQRDAGTLAAASAAAKACYAKAGITDPKSASIVETGAGSVIGQLMTLEALGLADPGKGAGLYDGGGSGPVLNPSGGSLPADPVMATGLVRLHEAAVQLAGRVGHSTDGAKSAIVHATGGVGMQNHCVFTLEV